MTLVTLPNRGVLCTICEVYMLFRKVEKKICEGRIVHDNLVSFLDGVEVGQGCFSTRPSATWRRRAEVTGLGVSTLASSRCFVLLPLEF